MPQTPTYPQNITTSFYPKDGTFMLLIDKIQEKTKVLGPGIRTALWFHGCFRHCPGCIAAEMNKSQDFFEFSVEQLLDRLFSIKGIEGISISGGEPFQQKLDEMLLLLSKIKQQSTLSIMMYTGYLLDELKQDFQKSKLLDYVDILVDGPYMENLDRGQLWRGSENQTIHFLSSRYAHLTSSVPQSKGRPIEVSFNDGLGFSLTGLPTKGFQDRLKRSLESKNMDLIW